MTQLTNTCITKIQNLYHFLNDQGMKEQQQKILDLYEKLKRKEMVIGFAGHFSAGKSTLINTLLDRDLLPSSPIPTSANIVKLKTGEPQTKVHFQDGTAAAYKGDVSIDTIKSLCKDGETITGLELIRKDGGLPKGVTVIDTPGVDSTNDADRLITESSLHVMDYMFYVMDYNHVQSEVNLMFLLEMQRRETPFSVVVNQVDKHKDSELSFEDFQESVIHIFRQWGIEPEHFFYTSMRDFSVPQNGYQELKTVFQSLFKRSSNVIEKQVEQEIDTIVEEIVREYSETLEVEQEELRQSKNDVEETIHESPVDKEWIERQNNLHKEADEAFRDRILNFIGNAYLMPSALREYAESYLEALQPDFKVGVFFSRKKTDEERQAREDAFYEQLEESIETNLTWPVRERMLKLIETFSISDPDLLQKIQSRSFHYPKNRLPKLVESGASVTGAYVLRYTDEVSKDIQKEARKFLVDWRDSYLQIIRKKQQGMKNQFASVFEAAKEHQQIIRRLEKSNEELKDFRRQIVDRLEQESTQNNERLIEDDVKKRHQLIEEQHLTDPQKREAPIQDELEAEPQEKVQSPEGSSVEKALKRSEQALDIFLEVNGLSQIASHLRRKRDRLANRQFTVSLFGAFSAGKSSFANALLGDLILPVSPNPTTAAINKISPPNEDKPNRTIDAYIKSEEQLLDDLSSIFKALQVKAHSIDSVYQHAREMDESSWSILEHSKRSFLRAFIKGYSTMKPYLGQQKTVRWEDFSSYVADEEKSCFVESMEVFYRCPLTEAGITLVDTPGADSFNARHTDVSFEYIKDSDAVLFVTYYNHPFSRTDQTFLTQLGRVKDSFAMDKMFFLINAADLAASSEELNQVKTYMKEQLLHFQIRHPRLYAISSLHALEEKQFGNDKQSGIQAFEKDFQTFLDEELAQMMIQSIEGDIEQGKQLLLQFIENSQLDAQERQMETTKIKEEKVQAEDLFRYNYSSGTETSLEHKVKKQLHYVHERMMLNFHDVFKRHYNPATIQSRGSEGKDQLKAAQEDLLEEVSFEMIEEVKAVCVRIEHFIEDLAQQTKKRVEDELLMIRKTLKLSADDLEDLPLPHITGKVDLQQREKNELLKYFKDTKTFFERNEKENMRDVMKDEVSSELKIQLDEITSSVQTHYAKHWKAIYMQLMSDWEEEVSASFDLMLSQLEQPIHTEKLEQSLFRLP